VTMGIVKWFNATKDTESSLEGGGPDEFVHISAVLKADYTTIAEGARVSYQLLPAAPGKCLRKICASGDATASHLEKPNHLMIRDGCGIRLQADSKPLRAMRCHARMALVVLQR
jgi:cold shock protein